MSKSQNYIRRTLVTIIFLIILFIGGLISGLPLIPWIETNYFVKETNGNLSKGITLKQINNAIIKIEIPNYFPQDDQCIDTWFTSSDSSYNLTIDNFSFKAISRQSKEINKENSYLFWDNGSKENIFKIQNYKVTKSDTHKEDNYVFLRNVYNLDNVKDFDAEIKIDFKINGKPESFELHLPLVKKEKLTWNKLKAH